MLGVYYLVSEMPRVGDRIMLCYELGGQAAAAGGLPQPQRTPHFHSHFPVTLHSTQTTSSHEFIRKH